MALAPTVTDDDVRETAAARSAEPELARGATLGRYIVLNRLGEGGMGVVYAAYDPELDRKLAVKLLREHGGAVDDRRARLVREAQALARLHHPNVVAVYDVGAYEDQLFVAMELVAGQTVTAWLAEAPRDWRAIVEVYAQAGRGLAAAHALGIVHRDFKPENVLVDAHGHARVVDFGLARTAEDAADLPSRADAAPDWEQGGEGRAALAQSLTRTGALVGTPGYIAPEQEHGKTSPAADQFSLCVALWRALYGTLPFAGTSTAELAAAARRGELRVPPRDAKVPAWLHRVLRRGLSPDPASRFPSMQQLLAALDRPRARRSKARAAAIALPLVATGGVVLYSLRAEQPHVCRDAGRELAGVWDGDRRAALVSAFAATKLTYAEAATRGILDVLDHYAGDWTAMRTQACEATRVRGEQSEELLDLRMACLDEHARDLRALTDVLVHADAKTVERWYQVAQALPPVSECADTAALKAPVRLPADAPTRARIDQLGGELAEARALDSAGKFGEAISRGTKLVADARATKFRPIEAKALAVLGIAQRDANKFQDARTTLEAAVTAAIAARDDTVAAEAALWLVRTIGYDLGKPDEAEPWIARAEAFLEAQPDDPLRAQLENNIGNVRFGQGRYDESLAHTQASLALREKLYGERSPLVAASLDNIGLDLDFKGDAAHGVAYHRKALAIDLAAVGESHPAYILTLTNLAVSERQNGELDQALVDAQHALAAKEKLYGPDSIPVSVSLNEVGNNYYFQHRYQLALDTFQRSLDIKLEKLGPKHPYIPSALGNMGACLQGLKRYDEAEAKFRESLKLRIEIDGPDHSDTANAYTQLAQLQLERKHYADALANFQQALAIWEKSQEPDSPLLASALEGIGETELGQGHIAAAITSLEATAKIRDVKPIDIVDRAQTDFALAHAYAAQHDLARALPRAEQASALYHQAGPRAAPDAAEVDAWLAEHRK